MSRPGSPRPPYGLIGGALVLSALAFLVALPLLAKAGAAHYGLGFSDDYDLIAASLAAGQGYRLAADLGETMIREPGYPLLLAGVFKALASGIEGARLANLLLAGAAALVLWRLALRITGARVPSVVAVAIFLLHPGTLVAEARGGVEMFFAFGALVFMLLLLRALEAERGARYLLAGIALGALVLIRSTPLLFPLVLVPYLVWSAPEGARRRRLAQGALLVAGMALALSPWVARNYAVSGEFVPTGTVLGVAAQEGQYTCERISFGGGHQALQREAAEERNRIASQLGLRFKRDFYQYFYTPAGEIAFNRALLARSLERYREHPALLARCAAQNVLHFWFLGKDSFATGINVLVQLPLIVLALAGLLRVRRARRGSATSAVVLFMAYVVAVHLPIMAHARHAIPLVPFLAIFAAPVVVALREWRVTGRAWLSPHRAVHP